MTPETLMHLIVEYRYWILFPLACFEGPMLAFIAGILVSLGYFNPIAVFFVLVLGDVIPDVTYYSFGRFGNRRSLVERYGRKIGITPERFEIVRRLWFGHTFKTMLITKFAYGLSTPLLITAGLVRLPFRRFWQSSVPLSVLQYVVLLSLGYFFAGSFSVVGSVYGRIQLAVAAVVILFLAYYFVTKKVGKAFLTEQEKEVEQELKNTGSAEGNDVP